MQSSNLPLPGTISYSRNQTSGVVDFSGQIVCGEFIAVGGSGRVHKGRWTTGERTAALPTIAVKIINLPPLRDEAQKSKRYKKIKRELELWSKINHQNILPLLGVACIDDDTNIPAFISPWMANGNAKEFCSHNPSFPPLLILYDIINGLQYLHTFKPEIVHGDIKAANVLINDRSKALLCDFGLSRFAADNTLWKTTASHAGGTWRWMAPQLLDGEVCTPTKASDIYAYAMTCYEILSGNIPFASVLNDAAVLLKVTRGQRPDRIDSRHPDLMWDIITRCWAQEPEKRPSAVEVLGLLRRNNEVVIYTKPPPLDTVKGYNSQLDKPRPTKIEDYLRNFEVLFVVDDSLSMKGDRWKETCDVLIDIAECALKLNVNTVSLRFFNNKTYIRGLQGKAKVLSLFHQVKLIVGTPTGTVLDKVFRQHLDRIDAAVLRRGEKYSSIPPLDIIVLTDGISSDKPESSISQVVERLRSSHYHPNTIRVQFVQIGNEKTVKQAWKDFTAGDNATIVHTMLYQGPVTSKMMHRILLGDVRPYIPIHELDKRP